MKKTKNNFEQRTLEQLKRAKVNFQYESESIPYILSRRYYPDFIITTPQGKIYIECKGYLRPDHKAKMVAVKKLYPELDIRMLFYSSNRQYIRWAIKHGFPYAIGTIPEEWMKGFNE